MTEQLVSYPTAKLAKEKGFKELCFAAFHKNNRNDGYFESGIISQSEYFKFPTMSNGDKIAILQKDYIHTILRPTQSLLQKFLREVHNLHVEVKAMYMYSRTPSKDENTIFYRVTVHNFTLLGRESHLLWMDGPESGIKKPIINYEEGLEIGLYQALKLIENEKINI